MAKGSQLCAGRLFWGLRLVGPGDLETWRSPLDYGNLKLKVTEGRLIGLKQGLGWDSVTEVGWRTRSLAERVGNLGVTVLAGPVFKKDYGTILEELRSKVFKKKIACRLHGLWMVVMGWALGPLERWPNGLSFRAGVWGAGLESRREEESF